MLISKATVNITIAETEILSHFIFVINWKYFWLQIKECHYRFKCTHILYSAARFKDNIAFIALLAAWLEVHL